LQYLTTLTELCYMYCCFWC